MGVALIVIIQLFFGIPDYPKGIEKNDIFSLLDTRKSDDSIQKMITNIRVWGNTETPIVGWSKDSKIAFIYYYEPVEPIGTLQKFVIMDLITDKTLVSIDLYPGSNSIIIDSISTIRNQMRKHNIVYNRTLIKSFPIYIANDTITPIIERNKFYLTYKNSKKIKEISSVNLELFSLKGYAQSPFENRIAIYYNMGCGQTVNEIAEFEAYDSFIGCYLKIGFR